MRLTTKQEEALVFIKGKSRILLYGGSRSGKTFLILFLIIMRALTVKSRHLVIRKHYTDLHGAIIKDTLPKICSLLGVKYNFNGWERCLTFANGSEIWFTGLADKERADKVLGKEYSTIYFNECPEIKYDSVTTALTRLAEKNKLRKIVFYDQNPPTKRHWTYKLFVEGVDPETKEAVANLDDYVIFRMNPVDNVENLAPEYLQTLMTLPKRKRMRFFEGEFQEEVEGALWTDEMINFGRIKEEDVPKMKRVVVAVDPAVSADEDSDETGIMVGGKGVDDQFYVFHDASGIYTPGEWGHAVVRQYKSKRANRVTAEKNNGGDLVKSNIQNIDRTIPVELVWASRGKYTRAEPVAALYEEGKVHHVGSFDKLEDELTTYTGEGGPSPNRLDALVWLVSDLMGDIKRKRKGMKV